MVTSAIGMRRTSLIFEDQVAKSSRNWIIVDLDGTLADYSHRRHYLKNKVEKHDQDGPDWDNFNRAAADDSVKSDILRLVNMVQGQMAICVMSGRSSRYAHVTVGWLNKHNIPCDLLLMRCQGDFRSDTVVKADLYHQHFVIPKRKVHFVLEDRDKVVEMWRSIGVTCLQVMKGEY